jgi:hypothetical protein
LSVPILASVIGIMVIIFCGTIFLFLHLRKMTWYIEFTPPDDEDLYVVAYENVVFYYWSIMALLISSVVFN